MTFELSEEHKLIQKTAREFAREELAPEVAKRDEQEIFPAEGVYSCYQLSLRFGRCRYGRRRCS
ncbi:MAG: acyl-CoA dehydrogenase family protein [candidate division KSB1 bacterium]|nr:acyl-CoA dehydrogenase family protein [candidate division KSB1 bacterium]